MTLNAPLGPSGHSPREQGETALFDVRLSIHPAKRAQGAEKTFKPQLGGHDPS